MLVFISYVSNALFIFFFKCQPREVNFHFIFLFVKYGSIYIYIYNFLALGKVRKGIESLIISSGHKCSENFGFF